MTEQSSQNQEGQQEQQSQQSQQNQQSQQQENQRQEQHEQSAMVPSSRLREETGRRQEAEKKLAEYETQQQQQEEKQAKEQGEWEQVAAKRQEKLDKVQGELEQLRSQVQRDAQYRSFTRAASGIVLPEAQDDAFAMLSDEDLKDTSLEDENSWIALAQRVAERKPYLADGARGTGSGGSARPALNGNGSKKGKSAIADMNSQRKRNAFK